MIHDSFWREQANNARSSARTLRNLLILSFITNVLLTALVIIGWNVRYETQAPKERGYSSQHSSKDPRAERARVARQRYESNHNALEVPDVRVLHN